MAVVYWLTHVYANFNNTYMVLIEIYSAFMVIQPILLDNNLWVLSEVLQSFHYKMLGMHQWVNFDHLWSEYSETINYFKFLNFKKGLQLQLSVAVKKYIVCDMMQNVGICLYSNNTTSEYFREPPTPLAFCFQ